MRVYESKAGSLYSRTGRISPPPPPPPSPSSPDLLKNSFEPQIRQTIHTIISTVHTTNLAISTYRNLCTSNVHKITAIKHLSLTADAVAISSLRKKYAQLITAEMKMCREVEGMKQGVVMLRLDLAELHELNGSEEDRRNDDVEGEGWMPNIGLSRRREEGADGSQGDGSADAWVYDLEGDEEDYERGSEDERYDGDADESYDEDEEEDDDAAPIEDPITELDGRYLNWIQDWQTLENRQLLITLLGPDSPTPPPDEMLSSNSPPFDEHRASYNRWEQAFDRDFEHNTSITEHEDLSIAVKWQCEQPEQKKSINIDNIYHWIGKYF
ncbi:hypothetical protein D6D24_07828 [Aureobasidium pullulans]|uniref:Uncharacterized protein n=1 Tax=Aureobasidium pullulans TaxID=5580 RepID=A0A4S8VJJ0_AURPU|nr:hypothetical protein D6D24_07828 [Aureobasidium pullulans]THW30329.1 hypothetical protein D6D22_10685 [Aureobasidium pullulans]